MPVRTAATSYRHGSRYFLQPTGRLSARNAGTELSWMLLQQQRKQIQINQRIKDETNGILQFI
jgi:hypothetical protein